MEWYVTFTLFSRCQVKTLGKWTLLPQAEKSTYAQCICKSITCTGRMQPGSLCAMLQAHECENNHCSAFCTLWPWRQKFKVSFFVACITCTCILRFDMQCMLCVSELHKEKNSRLPPAASIYLFTNLSFPFLNISWFEFEKHKCRRIRDLLK